MNMTVFRRLFGRNRRDAERELEAELRDHVDRLTADYLERGMPEAEARRLAAASFGGLQQAREYCRDVRPGAWIRDVWVDLRYGVRMLAHQRMFTAVTVLSLALGIGANAAIFTLVNSLLLRSLPVREPDRLVLLDKGSWTNPIWEQIRERQHDLFSGAAAWGGRSFDLESNGRAEPVDGLLVSGDFFAVLGVPMTLGRPILPANDDRHGSPHAMVAVVSYDFWQRHFGGDPAAIGRSVVLNHQAFTIIGIAAPRFMGPIVGGAFDVALPLAATDLLVKGDESQLDGRSTWWLEIVARLRPGQTFDAATAAMRGVQRQIRAATLPDWAPDTLEEYLRDGLTLVPAAQGPGYVRDRYQQPLTIIMAVVGLVLLIACANIANLMLARANARRHELTMRLALGASGGRLTRQLLTESLLLASMGAAGGFAFAQWGSHALLAQFASQSETLALDLSPDWRVLGFTTVVSLLTAVMFGTVPALRARNLAPIEALKEQGRGLAGGGRHLLATPLVVLQIALSLVLVVGAGLFMRSFVALSGRDLGFQPDPVVLVNVNVSGSRVPRDQWAPLFERLRQAAALVPGVEHAAFSALTPVSGQGWRNGFEFPDHPELSERDRGVFRNAVTPGWFGIYGAALHAGRDFSDSDRADSPAVAIVNDAFVRKYFAGENVLGRLLREATRPGESATPLEIVGVVNDMAYRSVRDAATPTVFIPVAQLPRRDGGAWPSGAISVRAATGAPDALVRSLAAALAAVDPDVSIRFRLLSDQVGAGMVRERVLAMLSAFFGGLALLLAAVGLYGVTAYAVSTRRTEIGLRMALGAGASSVVHMVMRRVALLVTVGVALGAGLSLWFARFVAGLLFGLEPRDWSTLVIGAVLLVGVGIVAAWIPASRAARIDPIEVLREG